MIPEKKFAGQRVRNLLLIVSCFLLLSVLFYLKFTYGFERLIINLFLTICIAVLLFLLCVSRRIRGKIAENPSENYLPLMVISLIMTAALCVYAFLPHYTFPFMLFAFLMAKMSSGETGIVLCEFFAAFFCFNISASVYELACYMLLIIAGGVLVPFYETEKLRAPLSFIVFCISVALPCIFSYLPAGQLNFKVIIYGVATGLVTDLLFILLFDKMNRRVVTRDERSLKDIISENYPLVQEIRSFSPADYQHAKSVSLLSAKCAVVAGLRADIAAAGGFYYRLGILGGEPVVENGVTLAQLNCFPQDVVAILAEFNGQERPISTPESAVVNMVNQLVSRFEHLREETSKSSWNREIVIYQTLNELSSSGLYDKSGLSINSYLQIREFLVRGDDL